MSQKYKVGDTVLVPTSKFKELTNQPYALYETKVCGIDKKSIRVDLPNSTQSALFGSSLAHTNYGIIIITIGDMQTELSLLDPLKKSILQFSRLLFKDESVISFSCRSKVEFEKLWKLNSCSFSYIILIGHGSDNGIHFGVDGLIKADEFVKILDGETCPPKHIISLCCKTGYQKFGGVLSKANNCIDFIAPHQSIHGAEASQFIQTFFIKHLLEGKSIKVAYKNANDLMASNKNFRLWEKGVLKVS
jgi:hypothetical protein